MNSFLFCFVCSIEPGSEPRPERQKRTPSAALGGSGQTPGGPLQKRTKLWAVWITSRWARRVETAGSECPCWWKPSFCFFLNGVEEKILHCILQKSGGGYYYIIYLFHVANAPCTGISWKIHYIYLNVCVLLFHFSFIVKPFADPAHDYHHNEESSVMF